MKYRPALDGLRALSVIAVLLFHGTYGHFPGGFLGVDVFFVLSGYLITRILATEAGTHGRIDFYEFYRRRARRLFPALGCVLILGALTWHLVPDAGPIGPAMIAIATYWANWKAIFSGENSLGPLLPLWSLSVEEQFYIVWPVVVAVVLVARGRDANTRLRRLGWVAVGAALACAGLRAGLAVYDPSAPLARYFSTLARADALLVGAAAGVLAEDASRAGRTLRVPVSIASVCLAAILALMPVLGKSGLGLYVGGFTVIALVAAVVVVHAASGEDSWLNRALSLRPLVEIGKRSYGLYLYHVPLFWALERFRVPHSMGNFLVVTAAKFALALGVAWVSFRFIERPLLARRAPAAG